MPPRLSEEQRRARKQQLAITATLAVVLGSAWLLGPGLRRVVVPHARAALLFRRRSTSRSGATTPATS